MPKPRPRSFGEEFVSTGSELIRIDTIRWIDCSKIEQLSITVHHSGGTSVATGIQAIEIIMLLKPSVLEGKRLRWQRYAWMVHNLIGHPLMQILAMCKLTRLAMRVHDQTVPRPRHEI